MILQQFSQDFLHASLTKSTQKRTQKHTQKYGHAFILKHPYRKAALKNVLSEHKRSLVWHTLTCAMDLHAPSCSSRHAPIPKHIQGWGRKATGPRKAASHLCSTFNNWLQRESVLEARYFFPEWQASLSIHVWTRQLHSETHDDKIRQKTVCWRGCTKTAKQHPSPPFLCTQKITVELLLLLSLRNTCLCYSKAFACCSSQKHLRTCLWSQSWPELPRFWDH